MSSYRLSHPHDAIAGLWTIIITCLLLSVTLLPSCGAFAPPPACSSNSIAGCREPATTAAAARASYHPPQHTPSASALQAVTKRQTFLLDGAELSYYLKSLGTDRTTLPNLAPRSPRKRNRVGAITLVTCTLDEDLLIDFSTSTNGSSSSSSRKIIDKGTQIIGVEVDDSQEQDSIISINSELHMYEDSIAILPSKISPADAISTAATSLLSVHYCSSHNQQPEQQQQQQQHESKTGKIVIVGGGEYATFLAKALIGLGNDVSLVSARHPWSLPSESDIAPRKKKSKVEIMPPAVGSMSLGFATAIGEFDTLIDTLGDEAGMGNARSVVSSDNNNGSSGNSVDNGTFAEQLKELHGCTNYVSTLTRSQQYVLKEGLLFARDKVLRYQKEVETLEDGKKVNAGQRYQILPPPRCFGNTVQVLLDRNIVYSADRNENGKHEKKSKFVRGWSLSDLTELKTWPREGPRRLGFPVVDLAVSSVLLRRKAMNVARAGDDDARVEVKSTNKVVDDKVSEIASVDTHTEEQKEADEYANTDIMITTPKSNANATIKITRHHRPSPSKSKISSNPHVVTIQSASELHRQIIEPKRHCILFLTASYCQKCKRLAPQFNRMARMSSSSSDDGVMFGQVDVANGPRGKQLGDILGVEKVPSVIVFRKGERVKVGREGDDVDVASSSSSMVVERGNLNLVEEMAKVLEKGERNNESLKALLLSEAVRS